MLVYKEDIAATEYDEGKDLLIHIWYEASRDIKDEEFREEMLRFLDAIVKYKPKYILVDQRKFFHVISINTNEWIDKNIHEAILKTDCEKVAFVVSSDSLAKLGTSQALQGEIAGQLTFRFFEDYHEACKWLGLDVDS